MHELGSYEEYMHRPEVCLIIKLLLSFLLILNYIITTLSKHLGAAIKAFGNHELSGKLRCSDRRVPLCCII